MNHIWKTHSYSDKFNELCSCILVLKAYPKTGFPTVPAIRKTVKHNNTKYLYSAYEKRLKH